MAVHDPGLEVAAHGLVVRGQRLVDTAGAANQRHQSGKVAGWLLSLVVVEQRVCLPNPQGREYWLVGLQFVEDGADHGEGEFPAAVRLTVEDGQRFDPVAVGFQVLPEVPDQGLRVLLSVARPFGALHGVQAVVIYRLFLGAANRVDQLDQVAGEYPGSVRGQSGSRTIHGAGRGFVVLRRGVDLAGLGIDAVGVDGRQEIAGDGGERNAAGPLPDALPLGVVELAVEPRQAPGQGTERIFVAGAHHDAHCQVLERDAGLADEWPAGGLEGLGDADRIDDHVVRFRGGGGGRHFPEIVMVEGARAAALHLLEVDAAPHVAHEDQAFDRLYVGAGGDHVHGDGDARMVVVAELRQNRFGIFVGPVGDLLAKLVALAELLAHRLDDVVGVAVVLGEDQRFGSLAAARKDIRLLVTEGADHGAYLIRVHDRAVQLLGAVGVVIVLGIPAPAARQRLSLLHLPAGFDPAAVLRPFGVDDVDLVADVDPVGHRLLV